MKAVCMGSGPGLSQSPYACPPLSPKATLVVPSLPQCSRDRNEMWQMPESNPEVKSVETIAGLRSCSVTQFPISKGKHWGLSLYSRSTGPDLLPPALRISRNCTKVMPNMAILVLTTPELYFGGPRLENGTLTLPSNSVHRRRNRVDAFGGSHVQQGDQPVWILSSLAHKMSRGFYHLSHLNGPLPGVISVLALPIYSTHQCKFPGNSQKQPSMFPF